MKALSALLIGAAVALAPAAAMAKNGTSASASHSKGASSSSSHSQGTSTSSQNGH